MADIEPGFDVEKDLPEFLSSVLNRTEECIHNSETDINDLQAQSVVLDRTISLLSSIAFTDIEQDRIKWESLAVAFAEVLRATENHLKTLAVYNLHQFLDVNVKFSGREILGDHSSIYLRKR